MTGACRENEAIRIAAASQDIVAGLTGETVVFTTAFRLIVIGVAIFGSGSAMMPRLIGQCPANERPGDILSTSIWRSRPCSLRLMFHHPLRQTVGLVEASTSRYKRIIGPGLKSRHPDAQHADVMIGVDILNQMFDLGRPAMNRIR